jgi:pimeloyl-ACP methyl ester carboxylesterase
MSRWKTAGLAFGTVGAAVGAAVAAQRVAAHRLRASSPDPDTDLALRLEFESSRRIPSHDGGNLFVVERGEGPVILLSHGVTLSVRAWAKQLRSLADAGFRVVAYDHRGHGESTLGGSGHALENLALDMRSVIEGLDLHDVVIVGHSMGGIATQVFCLTYPDVARERVAGIVLLSTLARSPLAATPRLASVSTWLADRLPDGAAALRARDLGLILARVGFGQHPSASHIEATRQMILATSPATRRDAVAALAGLDLSDRLGEIGLPTLVVCGTSDLITPVAEARRIARRIPGSQLVEVPGGGHMLMYERSELLDATISDFARRVQGSMRASAP